MSRWPTEDQGLAEQAVPRDLAAREGCGGERFQLRGDRGQAELLTHRAQIGEPLGTTAGAAARRCQNQPRSTRQGSPA